MTQAAAPPDSAGHRLVLSRARIRAQLARPPAGPMESLALPLLEGAEPAALAWRWACTEADRRLGDPVRAHPGTALGLAFGAGVLLAVARPWRWRRLPGLRLVSPLLLTLLTQWALPREPR